MVFVKISLGLILTILTSSFNERRKAMVSEKTLRRWRKDALQYPTSEDVAKTNSGNEMAERILMLTQELLDLYLIKKG